MINQVMLIQQQQHFISLRFFSFIPGLTFLFRSLPIDSSAYRHTGLHGQLSRIVTTVLPQNPFNQIDNGSTTINASIDSRPHLLLRNLPSKSYPSPRENEQIITD